LLLSSACAIPALASVRQLPNMRLGFKPIASALLWLLIVLGAVTLVWM
jgi:hypothetical protein